MDLHKMSREELIREIKELRQTNQDLQVFKSYYEELTGVFHSSDRGVRVIDVNYNVTKVNQTLLNMFGFTEDQLINGKCYENFDCSYCNTSKCTLKRIMAGEKHFEIEVNCKKNNTHLVITAKPQYSPDGRLIGVVEYFKDVTERKQFEEKIKVVNEELKREIEERKKIEISLQERQRHYEALLKALPVGLFQVNADGNCIYVNEKTSEIIGASSEEILNDKWVKYIHPEDREQVISKWETSIQQQNTYKMSYRFLRPDGTVSWVIGQAIPYYQGNELWYVGTLFNFTKLKEAQQALLESEEKLRLYIDKSPDSIFIVNNAGEIVDVNEAACEMSGYTKGELLKMAIPDIDKTDNVMSHFESIKAAGELNSEERIYQKKDGNKITGELKVASLGNKQYIGFIRDISKRKVIEDALRRSEEQYRLIFENSPMGICHFNKSGAITACNDKFVEILGSSKDKLIGFEMLTVEDEDMKTAVKLALQGRNAYYEQEYCSATSGKKLFLKAYLRGIISDEGKLIGAVGICEDITERRIAEEALCRSNQYNDLIIDGVAEVLNLYEVVEESNFRFLKVNDNFLELLNLEKSQVIGKTITEVVPEDFAEAWIQKNSMVVKNRKSYNYIETNRYGTFDVNIVPILDGDKCTHLLVASLNITDKKKMEKHLLQLEKLESIGLLAGGIAHDFNNILTVVAGNISLSKIKLTQVKGENINYIASLLNEAEKASIQARSLTNQLLTFAKGGHPVTDSVSISSLLKETTEFTLSGSNVKPEFNIPENIWPVEVDKGQIGQVIQNLIVNADQAMPNGGKIIVRTQNIIVDKESSFPLEDGLYVKVSIEDNGIGIPEKYQKKIFDPYFSTKQKGSGLGLATAHSIILKHKGYISLNSEAGKGTIFNVYLPASQKEHIDLNDAEKRLITGMGRIMVMDDEEPLRQIVMEMLNHLGYQADGVKDGNEAIQLYKEAMKNNKPFDAVIMDLTIPGGLGGKEAIQKLISIDSKAKAIVASGYSNDPVMANYQKYGFQAVIIKPFSIEELGETLQRILNNEFSAVSYASIT